MVKLVDKFLNGCSEFSLSYEAGVECPTWVGPSRQEKFREIVFDHAVFKYPFNFIKVFL